MYTLFRQGFVKGINKLNPKVTQKVKFKPSTRCRTVEKKDFFIIFKFIQPKYSLVFILKITQIFYYKTTRLQQVCNTCKVTFYKILFCISKYGIIFAIHYLKFNQCV